METNTAPAVKFTSLPSGTITFLFSDVEGSTRLWESYPDRMKGIMARHDELIESIVVHHRGVVVRPRGEGDSRFVVFQLATDAVMAAKDIQTTFWQAYWEIPEQLKVRIALHTGEAELRTGDYYGTAVNRCARLRNLAHGGQVLISQGTYGLVHEGLPAEIGFQELGLFTLKDLERPERVYQIKCPGIPTDFPPLRTTHSTIKNLPVFLTSFIGREYEIAEVKQLLGTRRLLTISGPGGAGKTRLAIQAASELLEQYNPGGWFVDLAPLSDNNLAPQYILNTMGIKEQTGNTPIDLLTYFFQDKDALLILDNCEQVLQGIGQLVQALIERTADLKILATSREPLGVVGETVWCIPSLSIPNINEDLSIENLMQHASVRLFVERARAVRPQFTINHHNMLSVAKICSRLDGIPLAIELAAARMKVLSVGEIASRLDQRLQLLVSTQNVVSRQRTLRNLIDWSHDLLPENERALLRRLSVFAAGWTLTAAEQVCSGQGLGAGEVLDLLSHLVDKSLVIAEISDDSQRYRLLETIRQYAMEQLEQAGEASVFNERHALYFTKMAEQSYVEIWGKHQGLWLEWLETEHDNLRTAMDWMSRAGNTHELYLRLAGSLWRFWWVRGYLNEGRHRLAAALRLNPHASPELRANTLRGAGKLALQQGDYSQALVLAQESLELFRQVEDRWGIARQIEVIGELAYYQGDYPKAVELFDESLSIRKALMDKEGIAVSLRQLGMIARDHGDTQQAKQLFEQSLELFRELEDKIFTAQTLNHLGLVEHSSCEYERANFLFEEAASLYRELDDKIGLSDVVLNLGVVAKDRGELKLAKSLCEQSLDLKKALGDKRGIAQLQATLGEIHLYQGQYVIAVRLVEQSLATFQELGVKRGVMLCTGLLGFTAHYMGDYERATSLAKEGMQISREIGAPRAEAYCIEILGLVASACNRLPESAAYFNNSIKIFDSIGDRRNVAITWINLARTAYRQGNLENANKYLDESLAVAHQLKTRWTQGLALEISGLLQRNQGNHAQALIMFKKSLGISDMQDNLQGIVNCLGAIAGLAIIAVQPEEGLQLFAAAQMIRGQIGAKMGQGDQAEYNIYLDLAGQQLDKERFEKAWSRGSSLTLAQAIQVARTVSPPTRG